MTQSESECYWKLGLAISLVIGGAITSGNCTLAQIVPDGTLGDDSSVVTNVIIDGIPSDQIEGGVRRETNLFHSFQDFNVGEEQRVYFANSPGVNNILTRVTGGDRSEILGQLSVSGDANLFLINPKGIIFGPKATLDLKGSFLTSTASSIIFTDGTQFSATAPQTSLLTVSVPLGLQFRGMAADIRVQGANLEVQSGRTLGLLGGNVTLEGGALTARGGRIELGSVASNSLVSLNPTVKGWDLGYEVVQNFQNVLLTKGTFNTFASEVSTSGEGAGDIQVQGRQVILADGSQITSINQGTEPGGNLTVTASESVKLIGSASGLSSETTSVGDAGDITINTGRLLIRDEALVSTQSSLQTTLAAGRGSNLTVNASESVELNNSSLISSLTLGSGNAGDITINTGRLLIGNRAAVSVSSTGTGNAGDLEVTADSILLDNQGQLIAETTSGKGGGNITLHKLDLLQMRRSEISTNAEGTGMGGDITIDTDLLVGLENSNILANAFKGKGGVIKINTQGIFGLEVRDFINDIDELRKNNTSDISAASQQDPSLNGEVEINRPDIDPSGGLVTLPTELVDVSRLIAQGCLAGGGNVARGASKFVATGRGGLPPTPTEALRSDSALADLGTPVQGDRDRASATISTNPTTSQPVSIVEAQGWVIGPHQGEVVLTAHAPSVTPHIPWLPHTSCNEL